MTVRAVTVDDTTGKLGAQATPPSMSLIRQHASYTLTSTTAVQQLFGTANGRVTLPVGAYRFNALVSLSAMSTTSGNAQFQLGGSAVFGNVLMYTVGADVGVGVAGTQGGSMANSPTNFPNSMVTAAIQSSMQALIAGTFEVTTAGTVIPSISLATAAAAVLAAGSFFECSYVGPTTLTTIGTWD